MRQRRSNLPAKRQRRSGAPDALNFRRSFLSRATRDSSRGHLLCSPSRRQKVALAITGTRWNGPRFGSSSTPPPRWGLSARNPCRLFLLTNRGCDRQPKRLRTVRSLILNFVTLSRKEPHNWFCCAAMAHDTYYKTLVGSGRPSDVPPPRFRNKN